jgi:restriction system protein
MARKKKTTVIDVLLDIAMLLPWWLSVLIAIFSYVGFHSVATGGIVVAKSTAIFGFAVAGAVFKGFALALQYIVPIIFVIGAAASAIKRARHSKQSGPQSWADVVESNRERFDAPPGKPATTTDQYGKDLYPYWRSADSLPLTASINTARWNADLLSALEWKRFEKVCAGMFERLGFSAKVADFGPDGGVDIHLYRPPQKEPVAIVQCKARTSKKVGVETVRAFHGVMTSKRITEAILATSSGFTDDAKTYAKQNHIDLMDGATVLKSILKLAEKDQASLLTMATEGDFTTPMCASCGIRLTKRQSRSGGKFFWGCINYPRCRSVINIASA